MTENLGQILFRKMQEALTNAIRHAKASKISIYLWHESTLINMQIIDDGIGTKTNKPTNKLSFGLTGIRERVQAANGKLIIQSASGCGTKLLISLPLLNLLTTEFINRENVNKI